MLRQQLEQALPQRGGGGDAARGLEHAMREKFQASIEVRATLQRRLLDVDAWMEELRELDAQVIEIEP